MRLNDAHEKFEWGREISCEDCGLILEEETIDRGPEWRAFNAAERDNKSRVGAPTTQTMHDKGLTTTIDWKTRMPTDGLFLRRSAVK